MYIVTSFAFFIFGGVLALLMRAELARPGLQFFSNEQYNQLFTMHGTIMLLLFATPIVFGFANFVMPLQIGSPDVSFPRLNAFSYWLYLVFATIAIAALSMTVWAHHMFPTGAVLLPFFSFMSFLIAIPTGVKFFNWIGTMWRGPITYEIAMMFALGFLVTFLFGGLTGVMLASPPIDFHVTDTYFVVAHFHYVLFGTIVFAVFAGIYFWFPKMTGRMLNEPLGKIHFWTLFVGFHMTFLIQHWLETMGMPRRYADYLPSDGFTGMNTISTIGSFLLGISMLPFLWNVWHSLQHGELAGAAPFRGSARSGRPSTCTIRIWPPRSNRRRQCSS